jgi:putative restriction endonuclease
MRVSLTHYVTAFANLRRAPRGWGMKKQPHKPLLLLAVADLVGSGYFPTNHIQLTPELTELFDAYWTAVLGPGEIGNIRTPFEHLEKEGFWHRTDAAQEFVRAKVIRLDDELFELLRDRESREILKAVLIDSCFEERYVDALREAAEVSESAAQLAAGAMTQMGPLVEFRARGGAFRLIVVRAYDYRCAICGVRIFNSEGRTVVEAAHIVPWSLTHDDEPDNGLALCRLCHWSFDAGMLAVDDDYVVLASSRLQKEHNMPGLLSLVDGRALLRPAETSLWPAVHKLAEHRRRVFSEDRRRWSP